MQSHTNHDIYKSIIKSQHCQRNWNLDKQIPEEDMKVLIDAATQCPSKQNIAFYKVHFIQDRLLIEDIHEWTRGFITKDHPSGAETNTQVLANLLILFEMENIEKRLSEDNVSRNSHSREFLSNSGWTDRSKKQLLRDAYTSVGVAAGYLNLAATLMGYSTGCCQCFEAGEVKKIALLDGEPLLLMGIGFNNKDKNRRRHHIRDDFMFSTKKKQEIQIKFW